MVVDKWSPEKYFILKEQLTFRTSFHVYFLNFLFLSWICLAEPKCYLLNLFQAFFQLSYSKSRGKIVTMLENNKTQSHLKNELHLLLQTSLENLYIFKAFLWLHAVLNEDPTFITFDHCTTFFIASMKRHKNRYLSQRHLRRKAREVKSIALSKWQVAQNRNQSLFEVAFQRSHDFGSFGLQDDVYSFKDFRR